ncbi:MAG: ATP phosphoribosyltransferase regulatory subunit, partial [Spirochaetota bacterium]
DARLELYGFIGSPPELSELAASLSDLTPEERTTLDHLLALTGEFAALGYGERVRIDLSEVGSQTYHSGVVFQAYAADTAAPIASGGRYDGLLARFGFDAASVGFSVMLRRLQSRALVTERHPTPEITRPGGESFRDRFAEARRLRDQGKVVAL